MYTKEENDIYSTQDNRPVNGARGSGANKDSKRQHTLAAHWTLAITLEARSSYHACRQECRSRSAKRVDRHATRKRPEIPLPSFITPVRRSYEEITIVQQLSHGVLEGHTTLCSYRVRFVGDGKRTAGSGKGVGRACATNLSRLSPFDL